MVQIDLDAQSLPLGHLFLDFSCATTPSAILSYIIFPNYHSKEQWAFWNYINIQIIQSLGFGFLNMQYFKVFKDLRFEIPD